MHISVIMASYLEDYKGAAKNRDTKFIRAVNSFLAQTYDNKSLVIVSDGCIKTNNLYDKYFKHFHNINLVQLPKQSHLSGNVRQAGLNYIRDKECLVCYLDIDDSLKLNHLENIVSQFEDSVNWVYYNDFMHYSEKQIVERNVWIEAGKIGTSSICHRNKMKYNWFNCDEYGHDWIFVTKLKSLTKRYKKINNCGYLVHHVPHQFDN